MYMSRKSAAVRLNQAEETLSKYTAAGLGEIPSARFMRDMIEKMKRSRYPTTKQRAWLDSIIEEGIPEPKGDLGYIKKIEEAIAISEKFKADSKNIEVLRDFKGRLIRGWELSPKQEAWCNKLIAQANVWKNGTFWSPDAKTVASLKVAVSVAICYQSSYWDTHPGGSKALRKVREWLNGDIHIIEPYDVKKALSTVSGKLREMEFPKFKQGDIAYIFSRDPCIVLDGPIPTPRGLEYSVLVDGEIKQTKHIRKRRLKTTPIKST